MLTSILLNLPMETTGNMNTGILFSYFLGFFYDMPNKIEVRISLKLIIRTYNHLNTPLYKIKKHRLTRKKSQFKKCQ